MLEIYNDDDDDKMDSNSPQSNETTTEEASSNAEWATCRLRNVLNEDCILKVLEFLNVYDLIQMCNVDVYFKNLITKWIIGKKLLNLRGMDQTSKDEIFRTFGKSMRKFIIYEIDFSHFLETVIRYCKPARLTEVELNLKQSVIEDDLRNIRLSTPYFSNLHKLKLNALNFERFGSYGEFLKRVALAASKLYFLQLSHVDIEGAWLKTQQMRNLSELRIHKPRNVSIPDFTIFLHSLSKLETLMFTGKQDITAIGSTLVQCCPDLKTFEDVHISNPYRHFTLGGMNRYNFLSSFANLHSVTLTSYTFCGCDLYYPLVKLSTKKIVKLRVVSDLEHAVSFSGTDKERIMQSSFDHFLSLQILEVDVRNFRLSGDLRCDFIMYLATQLKNLEKFTLESDRLTNANKIIEQLPQIRIFSMSKIIFKHLPVEMRKIVRTLRTIRQASVTDDDNNLLKLIVNIEQWRELQVYKDIDKLTETVLDPNVEPYNHVRRCPLGQ